MVRSNAKDRKSFAIVKENEEKRTQRIKCVAANVAFYVFCETLALVKGVQNCICGRYHAQWAIREEELEDRKTSFYRFGFISQQCSTQHTAPPKQFSFLEI